MKRILTGMALVLAGAMPAQAGPILDSVKTSGVLTCGLSTGLAGFATANKDGKAAGLDADICRAVSAATFGTADKVKFVGVAPEQRLTALKSGQIDLEVVDAASIGGEPGLVLAPTVFYDGAGFLVPQSLGVKSARQLSGAAVCLQPGTPNEQHLIDYFHSNKLDLRAVGMKTLPEIETAFFFGRCDAYMTDVIALAQMRIAKAPNPDGYAILPERISKTQLAPALRGGDKGFYNLVRWTIYTLIEAEERGVTARNVADMAKADDPGIRHLFATEPDLDKALPADDKRASNVIKSVGNYGEIFARNIGEQSPLHLARGQNALYLNTIGGQLLSPQAQSSD
jgi:general L-amino acid transport system substrate-binding protein